MDVRTTKPVSTISYNTIPFLKLKLEELRKAKIISFWSFIYHKAEADEKKDHIHLYFEPSKMIQTDDIIEHLAQLTGKMISPTQVELLCCMNMRSSKFDDWYLYCCHDEAYLLSKGQSREHHYCFDDFYASNVDELNFKVCEIDYTAQNAMKQIVEAQRLGLTLRDYLLRSAIPISQVNHVEKAWNLLRLGDTWRNGRDGHE